MREKTPTLGLGDGFNTSNQTPDQRGNESDLDELIGLSYTSTISDRASNVFRASWIREQLDVGPQTYFEEADTFLLGTGVKAIGFDGRDPFSIGQLNNHPSNQTGIGGGGVQNSIHTYAFDDAFSYFAPSLPGGEHTFKSGDVFAYALAPTSGEPLLFKGDGFAKTDIARVA